MAELRAVLFDMDGTLVASGAVVERHWRLFADRHGLDADAFLGEVHGVRSSEVIARIAPWLDARAEATALDTAEERDFDGIRAVEGAAAVLAALPPASWAVVTSAHRSLALSRLAHAGLPAPQTLVCGDETAHGKPDPEGYLEAARLLGADPADCLVVEDAPVGIAAGRAAGMLVLGITTNHTQAELIGADGYVADLRNLSAAVAALGASLPV
jgi:sugar-phosphatase